MTRISSRSIEIWFSNSSRWLCMLMYSPAAMEKAPARRPATPARTMNWLPAAAPAAAPATPMTSERLLTRPSFAPKTAARSVPERPPRCHASSRARLLVPALPPAVQLLPDLGVLAFVGRDLCRFGRELRRVSRFLVAFQRLDEVRHRVRAEHARQPDDRPHADARRARIRNRRTCLRQTIGPDLGVAPLVAGNSAERRGAVRILLDLGKSVVKNDRVTFEPEVGEARLALLFGQLKSCLCH